MKNGHKAIIVLSVTVQGPDESLLHAAGRAAREACAAVLAIRGAYVPHPIALDITTRAESDLETRDRERADSNAEPVR